MKTVIIVQSVSCYLFYVQSFRSSIDLHCCTMHCTTPALRSAGAESNGGGVCLRSPTSGITSRKL